MRCCAIPEALVCAEIVFRHPQLYHHELAAHCSSTGSDPVKRRENCRRQASPIMFRIWAIICPGSSGLPKNLLQGGRSMLGGFNCPDTTMILIDGQRTCTACASPMPSMLPGIWMSVHIRAMSDLDSRIATASSASRASIGV